jgi:hypothetical protein
MRFTMPIFSSLIAIFLENVNFAPVNIALHLAFAAINTNKNNQRLKMRRNTKYRTFATIQIPDHEMTVSNN